MRQQGKRLPACCPLGNNISTTRFNSIHVDDMARFITWLLRREPEARRLTTLNVAGRGEPLTFEQCIRMAHAKLLRVPGKWDAPGLRWLWRLKLSAIPPDAVPYMKLVSTS